MPRMTGGQALVAALEQEGLDTIFGLPGVQLDWAFDAFYAASDRIKVIHTRHEQATAYMADGYARTTGKVGAFIVVPGPGILNASAAISTAYATNSPVLAITGQIQSDLIDMGRGLLHEVYDQVGMLRHITKYAARASTPKEVPIVVHEAFRQMRSGRPRPTEIEIPPDVLARVDDVDLGKPLAADKQSPDPALIERAAEIVGQAERPMIVAGGGVISAEAWAEVRALAEMLEAPVVMSANGRGVLSERHPLACVALAAQDVAATCDAVIAIGTRLVAGGGMPVPLPRGPIVRIDADSTQLHRTVVATVGIAADAKLALTELLERLGKHNRKRASRRDEIAAISRGLREQLEAAQPQSSLGLAVRNGLPDDAIVVDESTQVGYWSRSGMPVFEPRSYVTSGYQGTLGYGFPTGLGAAVGNPGRRVVSMNGDGGFMFNVQELATAVQHNIPLTTIVFDDGAFGNVKRIQQEQFGGRTIASSLRNPDFAKIAEGFGMAGVKAESADALTGAVKEAGTHKGPVLIHVPVGPMPNFQRIMREAMAKKQPVAAR